MRVQTAKVRARQRIGAVSPEPSPFACTLGISLRVGAHLINFTWEPACYLQTYPVVLQLLLQLPVHLL